MTKLPSQVAGDGVERSYSANGTVIDYRKLSNAQLKEKFSALPPSLQEHTAYFTELFANINGYDQTNDTAIWDPPAHLRPQSIQTQGEDPPAATASLTSNDKRLAPPLPVYFTHLHHHTVAPVVSPPAPLPPCYGDMCVTNQNCINKIQGCYHCQQYGSTKFINRVCFV